MKMQPTTRLRYLASGVDGGQDDVVVPVGRLHPGALQGGGVRVVQEPRLPVQLLGRAALGAPRQRPHAQPMPATAAAASGLGAVDQQPAGGGGAVVGRQRRHRRRAFAGGGHVRDAPAGRWRGRVVVGGGGLVGGPVDEALEAGLGRGPRAPDHHRDFIGAVSAKTKK